jgi:hypothetical protein
MSGTLHKETTGQSIIIDKTPQLFERNTMFLTQIKHFIDRAKGETLKPLCSLEDGIEAQKNAEDARLSNKLNQAVDLTDFNL